MVALEEQKHATFFVLKYVFPIGPSRRGLLSATHPCLWIAHLQMVAFADRTGRARSTSPRTPALPLDGLETDLLTLQPFYFASPSASSPAVSSAPAFPPRGPPLPSDSNRDDGDIDNGGILKERSNQVQSCLSASVGIQENETGAKGLMLPPAKAKAKTVVPASPGAVQSVGNRGGAVGAGVLPGSANSGGRDKKNVGWVRARSRCSSRSPSGSPGGCWKPSATTWGGGVITPCSWDGWAGDDTKELEERAQEGGGYSSQAFVDRESNREAASSMMEFSATEFFRTADGRSLFAETLSTPGGKGLYSKRQSNGRGGGNKMGLLGDEKCAVPRTDGAKALGLEARLRRRRIDARSRDDKRREEVQVARGRVKRLENEVTKLLYKIIYQVSNIGPRNIVFFHNSSPNQQRSAQALPY